MSGVASRVVHLRYEAAKEAKAWFSITQTSA